MSIELKIMVLFCMIFCHIIGYFRLLGFFGKVKKGLWWGDEDKYKNDRMVVLLEHGFSWSFIMHLPIFVLALISGNGLVMQVLPISIIAQAIAHSCFSNEKDNSQINSLLEDQVLHFVLTIGAWVSTVVIYM